MRLCVPMAPSVFERPRPRADGKGFYSPHSDTLAQVSVLLRNQRKKARQPILSGPVGVDMYFSADSTTLYIYEIIGGSPARPKGLTGDIDNYVKFLLDAAQDSAVYLNDRQVVSESARFVTEEEL